MRIDPKEHLKHRWRVHELLTGFDIEDAWCLPVTLQPEHNLSLVQDQFAKSIQKIERKGLAGILFKLRFLLGRIFKWDKKVSQTKFISGSIRERYAEVEKLSYDQLPDPGSGDFIPVYNLEEESLAEIENATVHAAIHLSRVPLDENTFTVQMTIYVKPKGAFGQIYMWLIKPFRLLIVYPMLMKTINKQWQNYLNSPT